MRRATALGIALLFACMFVGAPLAVAGKKLENFEREFEEQKAEQSDKAPQWDHTGDQTTQSLSGEGAVTTSFFSILYPFLLMGLSQTGTSKELYADLKASGSPALPTFRFEPAYQYIFDGVQGFSAKAEAGYLIFGLDAEYLQYFESGDDFKVFDGHFLLRSLLLRFMGINLALGAKSYWGRDRHTGFDMGLPMYFYFGNHIILDIQPFWTAMQNANVYDISGGLGFQYRWIGVRAAYRMIKIGGQTLHGPRAGIVFQW